jgi:hypothetical protein
MRYGKFATFYLLAALVFVSMPPGEAKAADSGVKVLKGAYDPAKVYPGRYRPDMVYFRNSPRNHIWYRGINGDFPAGVLCSDAFVHFKKTGLWKGHLNPDGSCASPSEPSEWAVGNRLNYDAAKVVK